MNLFRIFSRSKTVEENIIKNSKSKKDLVNLFNWQTIVFQDATDEQSDFCRYLRKTVHTKDVTKILLPANIWAELHTMFDEGYEPLTVDEFLANKDNIPEEVETEFKKIITTESLEKDFEKSWTDFLTEKHPEYLPPKLLNYREFLARKTASASEKLANFLSFVDFLEKNYKDLIEKKLYPDKWEELFMEFEKATAVDEVEIKPKSKKRKNKKD